MSKMYDIISKDLKDKFGVIIQLRKRELFDDVIIYAKLQNRAKVISYIFSNYKKYLKLRVDMDDVLIYSYILANKNKIDNIKKKIKIHKTRFKWLYDLIKDEETFIKNVKEE